jgi:5-methylcytosine-specific restriction endonuclease McrA
MAEAEMFARDKQGVITAICKEMKHILLVHEHSDQKKLLDLRARLIIHEKAANCNKEIQEQELIHIQEMEIEIRGKPHRRSSRYYEACRTRHVCGIQEAVHKGIAQAIRRKLDISCKHAVEPIQKAEAIDFKPESQAVEPKKKAKAAIPKKVKTDVWNTYIGADINKHRCLCCKKTLISNTEFDVGHVVSEACGGTLEIGNLRPICSACNHSMGTRNMVDFVKTFGYFIG